MPLSAAACPAAVRAAAVAAPRAVTAASLRRLASGCKEGTFEVVGCFAVVQPGFEGDDTCPASVAADGPADAAGSAVLDASMVFLDVTALSVLLLRVLLFCRALTAREAPDPAPGAVGGGHTSWGGLKAAPLLPRQAERAGTAAGVHALLFCAAPEAAAGVLRCRLPWALVLASDCCEAGCFIGSLKGLLAGLGIMVMVACTCGHVVMTMGSVVVPAQHACCCRTDRCAAQHTAEGLRAVCVTCLSLQLSKI